MKLLAIESSCDETAAAVVEDGRRVLSSVIHSQIEEHRQYGGVVPEVASRRHAENIIGVTQGYTKGLEVVGTSGRWTRLAKAWRRSTASPSPTRRA